MKGSTLSHLVFCASGPSRIGDKMLKSIGSVNISFFTAREWIDRVVAMVTMIQRNDECGRGY